MRVLFVKKPGTNIQMLQKDLLTFFFIKKKGFESKFALEEWDMPIPKETEVLVQVMLYQRFVSSWMTLPFFIGKMFRFEQNGYCSEEWHIPSTITRKILDRSGSIGHCPIDRQKW